MGQIVKPTGAGTTRYVWYPGEKVFLQKLDKRLDDLYGLKALHPDRTRTFGMEPPK